MGNTVGNKTGLDVVEVAVMGPGVMGLAFGNRVSKKDTCLYMVRW